MMDPQAAPPITQEQEPLPATMAERPFGVDEAGRPLNRTKGNIVAATAAYMLECVGQRAAQSLPPGLSAAEREAQVSQARADALAQLVARLNAAITDPRYYITADYLLNEGNSYSVEFDAFLSEICRDISGDARFHFNRGARSISAAVVQLARPFSLRQVYSLLPRFAAKFAATEFQVCQVTANSAVIQWHAANDLALLPPALHRLFLDYSCQYIQGTFSSIPQVHSGLPPATIREFHCQLHGDAYCEWEFRWQNPARRGLSDSRPAGSHRSSSRAAGASAFDKQLVACPAPNPPAAEDLPSLPPTMEGRPFGADENGRPIRQARGTLVRAAVEQMQDYLAHRMTEEHSARVSTEGPAVPAAQAEQEVLIHQATDAALDQLVERLNAAIPDPAHRVSAGYLLNEANYYSHEFEIYVDVLAGEICGDPDFSFHRGMRSVPASVVSLARPLSVKQVYTLLPRFTAMVTDDDLRTVSTTSDSATIQLYGAKVLAQLPHALQRHFMLQACQAYQGAYMMVPRLIAGLPLATVKETHCTLRGDTCCEWEFTWEPERRRSGPEIVGGVLLSAALLGYTLARLPGWEWTAAATAVLPALCGWLLWRSKKLAEGYGEAERLLLETRDSAEKQYDDFQQTNANLQLSNVVLNQKLSELTALHEIGLALSATLDVGELLDKSLQAVTTHLAFDRALILLVEERLGRRVLASGRLKGGTPEMAALLAQLEISLEGSQSFLAEIVRSGRPLLVRDGAAEVDDAATRVYLEALQARAFLAVPLITQSRAVGLLAVDNALTGRSIPETSQDLLATVGAQIASAVDSARLYRTLEQRVTERTAELAAAMRRAEDAAAAIAEASREKDAALAETEQRAAELGVINSVSEAMASHLDVDNLIRVVGDKVLDIFHTEVATIMLYDPQTELIRMVYSYDRGHARHAPTSLSLRPRADLHRDPHPPAAAAGHA